MDVDVHDYEDVHDYDYDYEDVHDYDYEDVHDYDYEYAWVSATSNPSPTRSRRDLGDASWMRRRRQASAR